MAGLFSAVLRGTRVCQRVKNAGRCDNQEYLVGPGSSNATLEWRAPAWSLLEGPIANGLENHGCTDMRSAGSTSFQCEKVAIEFLAVEFTRDVEVQAGPYATTQEALAHYLRNLSSPAPAAVVINTGIHDVALVDKAVGGLNKLPLADGAAAFAAFARPWADLYERNLAVHLARMAAGLPGVPVVFVMTSPLRPEHVRRNLLIEAFNARAARVAARLGVLTVDPWPLLRAPRALKLYRDRIHASLGDNIYYHVLWGHIMRLLRCAAERGEG